MRYFLTLFAFLLPGFATAFTLPGSEDYKIYESTAFRYVYSAEYAHLLPELVAKEKKLNELYQKEFRWELDEKAYVILTSPRHQIANGFATVVPLVETVFFPGGSQVPDFFAADSWLDTLLVHEVNHLYQLNVKPEHIEIPKILKAIFGNAPFVFITIVPVFPQPNIFSPGYLTEGGATYNEARFGIGGRLYNGAIRAQVYATLREEKQPYEKTLNADLDFPLDDDYSIGAYLAEFKAMKLNDSSINNLFFQNQSYHYINPFILDSTYRQTFGTGYKSAYQQFLDHYKNITPQQVHSQQPAISTGIVNTVLNKIGDEIVYLDVKGLDKTPDLVRYNIKTQKVEKDELAVPSGKVFKLNGKFVVASATRTDVENVRATLVGDGHSYSKEHLNQSVQDISGDKVAYFAAEKSFDGNILMVNDESFGPVHSSAVFDQQGRIYYFKQEQNRRVLYRDRQKLTSFPGYWGFPTEVYAGDVYFVAATEFGASLFKWNGSKITRMSPLDTITDASLINESKALISEVTGHGFEQKVVDLKASIGQPVLYDYPFSSEESYSFFDDVKADTSIASLGEDYSSFSQMRYSNTSGFISLGVNSLAGSLVSQFTDPLLWQTISLGVGGSGYGDFSALAQYTNSYYRLNWYLGYYYSEAVETNDLDEVIDSFDDQVGFVGFSYPLFKYHLWSSAINLEAGWESDEDSNHNIDELFTSTGLWRISYAENYSLAFDPYRLFSLQLGHRHEQELNNNKEVNNMSLASGVITGDLGYQNYLRLSGIWGFAQSDSFEFTYRENLRNDPFMLQRLVPGETIDISEMRVTGLQYKKALNYGLYFNVFPISLRRFAPFIQGNYYDLKEEDKGDFDENFATWGGGIDFEFLLFHRIPFRFSAAYFEDNLEEDYIYRLQLSF